MWVSLSHQTIFELGVAGSKDACRRMKLKRKRDDPHIRRFTGLLNEKRAKYDQMQQVSLIPY